MNNQFICTKIILCNSQYNFMFPSVAKEDSIKEKIKEKQWDDRFVNKGTIPEYSPLKDKHTKSYRRLIANPKKQQQAQPTNKSKKTTYFQKRLDLIDELVVLHKPNQQLLQEYEELAGKYKLPNFYIYYSLLPLLSSNCNITQYLFNQKKLLKEQSSSYHKISTAIKARQQCLDRIRKTLADVNEENIQENKSELKEQVEHLRFLTENVIDQIKKWRDYLKIQQKAVFYNQNQENYLIKILNDNKFIFNSKLALSLSFAEKNDPFLLIPVKKAEGKQASMFTEIVQLSKDVQHYQRYMEYLASEKAFQLTNTPIKQAQGYKNPSVQKVYKSTKIVKPQVIPIIDGQQQEGYKKIEALKMREQRLKKNQQRIKSIKSIYETYNKKIEEKQYRSERKAAQTDNEDRKGLKKRSQSIKIKYQPTDIEFESMVKNKLEADRSAKTPIKKIRQIKSMTKFPKTEDKMIENLKDIQSTLRNKLQILQSQQKPESSSSFMNSSQQKFTRKNNEQIIKELKQEIMSKIQKETQEKDRIKKIRREQEEKMLEQIKDKLKKQMEEKLEQKKKEKLLEREQLEKKLKEEQDRLNSQKQLELQLQLKLNREKELRQLEKIKRESLERERRFKDELQKEQSLRKDREEMIEKERREKEKLIEQLKKKEIKEQIEQELRNELKYNQDDKNKSAEKIELDYIRTQKHAELSKQLQQLKLKQGVEMEQLKKQNLLRERMLRLKKDEQEFKRKEIEHLMKIAIQNEKQQLEKETIKRRIEIEESMRNNVKERLLEQYKGEKQAQVEKIKLERQKQVEEEVYRDKIRDKIERQMRIEAINRTKKDLDERENKKYQIKSKLDQVKFHFEKEVVLDKNKIQNQVKKEMIEKVIFDKQAEKEAAKNDLRMQFEKELMASAIPQIYENKQSFLLKNTNYLEGDLHLNSKLNDNKPTNQKPAFESPNKKSEVKQLVNSMTLEQLQVYEKQKEKINETKEEQIILPSKSHEEEEGFEPIRIDQSKRQDDQFEIRIIKSREPSKKEEKEEKAEKQKSKKKKKRKDSSEEIDSEDEKKKKKRKQKKHYYQQESEDSEDMEKRKKKAKRNRRQSSDEPSSQQQPVIKKQHKKKPNEEVEKPVKPKQIVSPIKQIKPITQQSPQKTVVHYDINQSNLNLNFNPIEQVVIKPQKVSNASEKFKITLEAIPEAQFDQYLQTHMSRVPLVQIAIQMHDREQLYRKLIGQLTFCLLVGQYEGRVIGLAIAYHDRNRQDIRKYNIIHIATYKSEDLKDFILSSTNFIFRKDPVDQIEFLYKFSEQDQNQKEFSLDFNKWFDKYGSVFQKKVDESKYERKYVLKRQFNQKCEVVLGGINKNTFRNIFSVYCGVLMSDTDMLQFKEELVDTLAPENQICYSIMVAELFRTYLSPDQAESMKNKVKEFVKLKEMLILVVMMQKKKLKLDQLKLYEYKNLIELNMRLMSQGKQIIRYCKDSNSDLNRLYYSQLNHSFNLPFHFQTTSLPVEGKQGQIRQISYFRLSSLPPFKLHIIKSSLYNAQMNILPTENSKYKIFIMNAQQYNEIKQANHIDLFMYIRLFLKNVKSHNVAVWKYVWMPEMTDKGAWNLREFKSFLSKDFYTHDSINISYRQFLPGALIIQPQHRDLVITPPFIVGVMSMGLEQVSEGSPLYARMIELDALKTLEVENQERQQ